MPNQHPAWAASRLLPIVNFARRAEDIFQHPDLQDDPSAGGEGGYSIGQKVAQNIIDYRSNLPRRRYENVEQLLDIPGLGADKLNDLLFSFSTPADEAFKSMLFDGILYDNWEVKAHSIAYITEEEFLNIADNALNFRIAAANLYANTLSRWSEREQEQLKICIHYAYHENYYDGHLGAFQLALWWYTFDYDNWFSYDRIKEVCERYLSYHPSGHQGIQLRVIRLHELNPIAEFQRDLMIPVIVNYPEFKITVWEVQLND